MMNTLRCLHIEDNPDDSLLIKNELRKLWPEVVLHRVETAAELKSALGAQNWDVILSDHSLPGFDAIHALEIVKQSNSDTPFIIVSGSIDDFLAVSVMRNGAHDYILKNNIARLNAAVEREIRESRVRAKNIELEQVRKNQIQQLIRADKLASIGLMTAGISHEVNNPLGYVISNLEMLERYIGILDTYRSLATALIGAVQTNERAKITELLVSIDAFMTEQNLPFIFSDLKSVIAESHEGAVHIRDIVQRLKVFFHDDSELCEAQNINEIVEISLKLTAHELKYKCDVVKNLGDVPLVPCHPGQMSQVFMNLIINAAHAIEKTGKIEVTTYLQEGMVVVSISDNGSGISQENLSKLFTPFFTTKPTGVGTGLGLSVSKEIIASNGGRIEVASTLGQGTTFKVFLPDSKTKGCHE